MKEHEILLGRNADGTYIKFGGGEPVGVHARTGSGKSADFGIPNCFTWPGSLVVLDIKGDAFRHTGGHRAAMGQDVYVLAPGHRSGRSHRWDPLASVRRTSIDRFRQIASAGNIQFPEIHQIGSGGNNSKFWDDAGRQAFKGVALFLAEALGERLSMERITRLFLRADGHEFLSAAIEGRRGSDLPFSQEAVDSISDYICDDDPKLRGDIRKTVSTALQLWTEPHIAALTSGSDFDLRDLRRKPMTIYVVVSPADIGWVRPLLRVFFDQLINLNTDVTHRQDPSIKFQTLILMDEFVRLNRMDTLAHAAQYTRDYGIRMAYVVQNKAQVSNIYGPEGAADIFGNLGAEVIFGTNDQQVVGELENRLGDNSVVYANRSMPRYMQWANWGRQTESEQPHRRPLMLDQEIAQMAGDEQLILRSGMKPMKTNRARWFTDVEFTSRVRPPPLIPKLDVSIAYDDGNTRVRSRPRPELARKLP